MLWLLALTRRFRGGTSWLTGGCCRFGAKYSGEDLCVSVAAAMMSCCGDNLGLALAFG